MAGSLNEEVQRITNEFAVDKGTLEKIAGAIREDVEKGLTESPGSIPVDISYQINAPTGNEKGTYLGLDLGRTIKGTNLRICLVDFEPTRHQFDIAQSSYRVPESIKTGTGEQITEFVATCLKMFLEGTDFAVTHEQPPEYLALTFSFPVEQDAIDEAKLKKWLRGFDVKDMIGKDVVPLFQKAFDKQGVKAKIVGVLNDCVGTLAASTYCDQAIRIGGIFGTGSSIAYYESVGAIPKLKSHSDLSKDALIALNVTWGEFNSAVLPRNDYDKKLDSEDPTDKGQHIFEKMFAGLYIPELLRVILLDLNQKKLLFQGQDVSKIQKPYSIDAPVCRTIEADPFDNLFETEDVFHTKFGLKAKIPELKAIRAILVAISTRAARLVAAGLAGIYQKMNKPEKCSVGSDGSLFMLYPTFGKRMKDTLDEILGANHPLKLTMAEDGNGVGSAIIGAMTVQRAKTGDFSGIKNKDIGKQ